MAAVRRLLILGAGTGAANNLIRSLRAGDPTFHLVGGHHDRFVLKKAPADRRYLLPAPGGRDWLRALRHVVETERIDLLIPDTDADVDLVSRLRRRVPCRVFLPRHTVIARCQDKYALTVFLRERGIAAPETYPLARLGDVGRVFRRFGRRPLLWCRIRTGFGSMGALPVKTPEQARSWIAYWQTMRGIPVTAFTLSEYLPGRDYSFQCLWKDGALVLAKMSERLAYFGGGSHPSGVSSTPALGKTLLEPRVAAVCTEAIRALDRRASGIFCFDLKEDVRGEPCITEINAGRFAMITSIYDLAGKHNMAATYVRLALGDTVDVGEAYADPGEYYLVRDLDTMPGIFQAQDLFDGIEDARP